jgi:hypothetical protein
MLVDIQFLDNLRGAKNNYSFLSPPKIRELGALVSGYDYGEIRGLSASKVGGSTLHSAVLVKENSLDDSVIYGISLSAQPIPIELG